MKKFVLCALALLPLPVLAETCQWDLIKDKSSIGWSALYSGNTVAGAFTDYKAEIVFDPQYFHLGHAMVSIETAKIKTDDKDAKENLSTYEWLESKKYPLATFKSTEIRH